MRVVHVVESLDTHYGGPAQSVPSLARESIYTGAEIVFVSANWSGPRQHNEIIETLTAEWIQLAVCGPSKLRYSPKLYSSLRKIAANPHTIIHVHNLWNYFPFAAYLLAKKYHVPLVVSLRGTMSDWALAQRRIVKKLAWQLFQRRMLNGAALVHATSKEEALSARKAGVKAPIVIIPNGVNLNEFERLPSREAAQQALDLDSKKKYVLFLSRLHPKKGIEMLIQAWSEIPAEFRESWELIIVGSTTDARYQQILQDEINKTHSRDTIHMLGHLTGKLKVAAFSASEIYILPSHTENFGIAVLEALACGLPVITTVNTPWKIVQDKKAGFWIPLEPKGLVAAMGELMNSPQLREAMSKNALDVASEFQWSTIGQEFSRLYRKILNGVESESSCIQSFDS